MKTIKKRSAQPNLIAAAGGFTLWELLIALTIIGLLMGLGVPNYQAFTRNARMTGAVNTFVSALHAARSEAVKRQVPITVCATNAPAAALAVCNGRAGAFIAFTDTQDIDNDAVADGNGSFDGDDEVLILVPEPDPQIRLFITPGSGALTFLGDGYLRSESEPMTTILFCDARGNADTGSGVSSARVIQISPTGRPQLLRDQRSISLAATVTGGECA